MITTKQRRDEQRRAKRLQRKADRRRRKLTKKEKEIRRATRQQNKIENAKQRAQSPALVVFPFREWCVLRGISAQTGYRLITDGHVKVTRLSERKIGIRSDHDREYLDSCLR